ARPALVHKIAARIAGVVAEVVGDAALLLARRLDRLGEDLFQLLLLALLHLQGDEERERLVRILHLGLDEGEDGILLLLCGRCGRKQQEGQQAHPRKARANGHSVLLATEQGSWPGLSPRSPGAASGASRTQPRPRTSAGPL